MAAGPTVVRTGPCHRYTLPLAPAVHHKLGSPVVAPVRIHAHNPVVLEEVGEVCCSPEKDECLMSSSQCRKWDGHQDDADGMMRCL